MPDALGKNWSATNPAQLAPGSSHDAAIRRHRNVFDLATNGGGGAQSQLVVAKLREGNALESARLSSSVSLAGVNFSVGTDADNVKYADAVAGPAAGATVSFTIKPAALAADALSTPEIIKFYPSGNLPGAGTVVAQVNSSMR
jgi:hypothetical protein